MSKIDEIPIPHLWSVTLYPSRVFFCLFVCHRRNIHSCYFLQLSSETWRPWVKQSDQSKTKTQTKRLKERYSPLLPAPPPPKWKNIACCGNAIFLQTRKNDTPPPLKTKNYPPKKKVQSSPESSPAFPSGLRWLLRLKSSKYWPTLEMRGQMNGTAIPWRTVSFTEHRYPEGWKTAYRRAGWYCNAAH